MHAPSGTYVGFLWKMLLLRDQVTISPSNLSPVVSICSVVCLLLSTLSVAGRVFTKAVTLRHLDLDDFTILAATVHSGSFSIQALLKMYAQVLSIGQTVAVLSASTHGLGRHWSELDQSHRSGFEKVYPFFVDERQRRQNS